MVKPVAVMVRPSSPPAGPVAMRISTCGSGIADAPPVGSGGKGLRGELATLTGQAAWALKRGAR